MKKSIPKRLFFYLFFHKIAIKEINNHKKTNQLIPNQLKNA